MAAIPTRMFYGRRRGQSSLAEAERILNRIVEAESDLDLSDEEAPELQVETEAEKDSSEDESESEEEQEEERHPLWARSDMYGFILKLKYYCQPLEDYKNMTDTNNQKIC
ncbi:hypothetical protein SKAU_G00018840 [Synaphobranchus kaupii]|uniref:Uncharacterized protein n=1 Tax=Synaphobranchus kaupii TaxID=118154 RepID=A0A9Q1GBE4_SYNKA|nr:hypothetical protein SKAU_G00018840 [Synaphobranchus kaupii]